MINYSRYMVYAIVLCTLTMCVACSENPNQYAGGSSEETNAIVGVVTYDGDRMANGLVALRKLSYEPTDLVDEYQNSDEVRKDTTNSNGEWEIQKVEVGTYLLEASYGDSLKSIQEVIVTDENQDVGSMDLNKTGFIVGFVSKLNTLAQGIKVYLEGTDYVAYTNEDGLFRFENIADYQYHLIGVSNESFKYDNVEKFDVEPLFIDDSTLSQLVSNVTIAGNVVSSELEDSGVLLLNLPLHYGYALQSYWAFDAVSSVDMQTVIADETGRENYAVLYGNQEFIPGIKGNALKISGDDDFAVAEDSVALKSDSYSITAWVRIDSLPADSSFQFNLFGKTGIDPGNDVFSFTFERGYCGATEPMLALNYATVESEYVFSCENSIATILKFEKEKWYFLAATFSGSEINFYVDGQKVLSENVVKEQFQYVMDSEEPFYFAKEAFYGALDEIKIFSLTLSQAEIENQMNNYLNEAEKN